jgi:hypothetical protein
MRLYFVDDPKGRQTLAKYNGTEENTDAKKNNVLRSPSEVN